MPAITFAPFPTRAQYEAFEAEILDASATICGRPSSSSTRPGRTPRLCSKCKEEKA